MKNHKREYKHIFDVDTTSRCPCSASKTSKNGRIADISKGCARMVYIVVFAFLLSFSVFVLQQVEGSEWWKGRTREGRESWFPKKWIQILERKPDAKKVE